jgi:hypothetical protein
MGANAGKTPPGPAGAAPSPSGGGGGGTGGEGESGKPKLFVQSDESWKAEAQREKERLAKQAAAEEARRDLPPPTFAGFMSELGLQAMLALGLMEVEGAPPAQRDLPAARYTIDLLGLLEEKTKGNLSEGEKHHLDELLQSLRIHFARVAKAELQASKKVQEPPKKIIT